MTNKRWAVVVVDGVAGADYDGILENGPTFHPDGVLEFLAVKDQQLLRVRLEPGATGERETAERLR